jgi:hypothetical protein
VTSHSFHIARWQVTYRATSTAEASELRDRLDRMIQAELTQACADQLTRDIDASDSSVWLIRHLDLGLTLPAELARAANSAQRWGEHLAARIQATIHRGEESDTVIHFPSRAAYVAQFVRDLAAGRASGKWYYDEFSSLLQLPASRAIFQALTDQPDHTGEVLLALISIRGLRDVLLAMTEADARGTFEAWRRSFTNPTSGTRWVGQLLEVWNDTPLRTTGVNPFRDALWWATVTLSRHAASEGDGSLLETTQRLLELRELLSALNLTGREWVIGRLADGDLEGALASLIRQGVYDGSETLAFFQHAMEGDVEWARNAQGVLLGEDEYVKRSAAPKARPYGPAIPSPHAGVFRLGSSFVASDIQAALASLESESRPAFLHLVAMKCMGRENAHSSFSDAALRAFSSFEGNRFPEFPAPAVVPPRPTAAEDSYFSLADMVEGISDELDAAGSMWAQAVLRHFKRRLIGFESSTAQHLYRNFLSGGGFVRDTGDKIIVEIPPPALAIVLSIAGILEESYVLPWIEGREICVLRLPQ